MPETGQLQRSTALDFEAKASYSVTVSVHDGKDADGNGDTTTDDTIEVTINVVNVDEAGKLTPSSTQPRVGAALTATLTDADGVSGAIVWMWHSSPNGTNAWAAISGSTAASYTPVTADVGYYLRVTASYTDGEGSGKSAEAVSANPVGNAPPPPPPPPPRQSSGGGGGGGGVSRNRPPVFADGEATTRTVAENTAAG